MRSIHLRALVLGTALALAAPAGAEPVGFIAGIEGTVEITPGGQLSWTAAALDQQVEIGDTVRTGTDSAVKIVLVDDTALSLGDETELVIDSFVVGPAATREPSVLRHLSGQIRTRVGEAFGGTTRIEVHTPTAVMGVKGTVFSSKLGTVNGEPSTLACNHEGLVFVRFLNDLTTWDIPLGFCRRAFLDRVEEPIEPPLDFQAVTGPSPGADAQQTQALLFGPENAPGQGLADWLASTQLPPVATGPGSELIDIVPEPEPEPVFDSIEDVVAATGSNVNGAPEPEFPPEFEIPGGETPPEPED